MKTFYLLSFVCSTSRIMRDKNILFNNVFIFVTTDGFFVQVGVKDESRFSKTDKYATNEGVEF